MLPTEPIKEYLPILHQGNGILGAISWEVRSARPEDGKAKRVNNLPNMNGGTLVFGNELAKIVCSFFRRHGSLGII